MSHQPPSPLLPDLCFIYWAALMLAALTIKRHLLLVTVCSPSIPDECQHIFSSLSLFSTLLKCLPGRQTFCASIRSARRPGACSLSLFYHTVQYICRTAWLELLAQGYFVKRRTVDWQPAYYNNHFILSHVCWMLTLCRASHPEAWCTQ